MSLNIRWSNSRSVNDYDESEADKDKSAKTNSGGSTPCGGSSSTQTTGLSGSLETEKKRVNASVQVRLLNCKKIDIFVFILCSIRVAIF